ncbi:MAG: hypothetical protein NT169_07435 [Chloroflexi bacterium]|nr:hypothetical protein [Chloroflexota bacterium]
MHRLLPALLILFLCAGCYPAEAPIAPVASVPVAQPPTATPKPLDLTILHTNDTWGYLLPCG